jgi:hypothetical protein
MLYQAICLTLSSSKQLKIITQEMKAWEGELAKNHLLCAHDHIYPSRKEHGLNCENDHKITRLTTKYSSQVACPYFHLKTIRHLLNKKHTTHGLLNEKFLKKQIISKKFRDYQVQINA